VGSADDCRRTVAEVIAQHGRLDVLVNNAGITVDRTVLKMTDEDWYKAIAVNLSGAFFMSQAVLPHMLERGSGRIINISSIVGETGNIGQANYAASKSGLFGLTKTLARERGDSGSPTQSSGSCTSWPLATRRSSPARYGGSTAGRRCEPRARGHELCPSPRHTRPRPHADWASLALGRPTASARFPTFWPPGPRAWSRAQCVANVVQLTHVQQAVGRQSG
jgi:NAD(P)-dependent dehydrogenase (short-subunit alcohol dehydrogenase family)